MSVSIYIFPLQFNNRVPNNIVMTIAGAFLSIVVLTIMVANIINQFKSNKIKKFLKPFYTNGLVWVIIFVLFWSNGVLIMLKTSDFNSNFYVDGKSEFIVSAIWSALSLIMFYIYLSDCRKMIRQVCWIEYIEADKSATVRYYIFYASDREYVICGKKDKYEENQEYRFFKISELKEKYIIHFDEVRV